MNTKNILIPENEVQRLEALRSYDILDTGAEERFDRVTRMVQRFLEVPICLVSLIDAERQWFKSRQGLDATETPRDISFCTHAILHEETMVVPNALEDPRFRANPLVVQEPKIRFYAGAPLVNQAGYCLGTLCAIDRKPRELTAEQKTVLADFAQIVVDELELRLANRRHVEDIQAKEAILEDFDAVFSNIDCAVMFMGPDFRARLINDEFRRMWNVPKYFAERKPTFQEMLEFLRETGIYNVSDAEWPRFEQERNAAFIAADGSAALSKRSDGTILEYKCIPLPDSGRMLTYLDVTERERIAEVKKEFVSVLEKKNKHLSELYKTAHQFVDNVSHEFRTPLTVIKEFASILHDGLAGDLNQDQKEYAGIIMSRIEDLSLMVSDMLDISRLEAGLLGARRRVHSPSDIVERVRSTLERKATSTGVALDLLSDANLPAIYCDAENIGRVIINLVVNACKFCGEGGTVRLSGRHEPQKSHVVFGVTDSGPGIAAENLQAIFERFKQVGGDIRTSTKGVGLGLNISKELVELNYGGIAVESEIGKGSTFTFTVPTFDPVRIVECFVERVRQVGGGSSHASLITVRVDDDADIAADKRNLEEFLERQTRCSDLLFKMNPGGWLICAASNQAHLQEVVNRILTAREEANRNMPEGHYPELEFVVIGTWKLEDDAEGFLAAFETEWSAGNARRAASLMTAGDQVVGSDQDEARSA